MSSMSTEWTLKTSSPITALYRIVAAEMRGHVTTSHISSSNSSSDLGPRAGLLNIKAGMQQRDK